MKYVALLLIISAQTVSAGLGRYSSLVLADNADAGAKSNGVRITYLGTNGYQFETCGHALLIDPYFSRISLPRTVLGWRVEPDLQRIDEGLQHVRPRVDAILATHGHVDHLLDAAVIMRKTGARLIGSRTAVELARRAGSPSDRRDAVRPGNIRRVGPWKITVLPATHDRVFMIGVPFRGPLRETGRPTKASQWVVGEALSYLIEANGQRIFLDSGGTAALLPPSEIAPVDLAILGMALPDSRARFAAAMRRLRPRYVLPSHQDNFFLPLRRGFQFGQLTNFPGVLHQHQRERLPGRLILLDYFRPWTLTEK